MKQFRKLKKLGNLLVAMQIFSIIIQPHCLLAHKQPNKKCFVETLLTDDDFQYFSHQNRAPRPNPYPSIFPDLSKDPQEKIQLPRDITVRTINVTDNLSVEGSTYIAGDLAVEGGITVDVTETTGPISLLDQGEIRFYENQVNGNDYIAVQAPAALSSGYSWRLPLTRGDAEQVLTSDGLGNLEWVTQVDNPANFFVVTKGPVSGIGQFNSVKEAVDAVVDSSPTNLYVIWVGPGVFVEDTIVMKQYMCIVGDSSTTTIIQVDDPAKDVLVAAPNSAIIDLTLIGASDPGKAAIVFNGGGTFQVNDCSLAESDILLKMDGTIPPLCAVGLRSTSISSITPFSQGIVVTNDGVVPTIIGIYTLNWLAVFNPLFSKFFRISGPNTYAVTDGFTIGSLGFIGGIGIEIENGAIIFADSMVLSGFDKGIHIPNVGSGPTLNVAGAYARNNIQDLVIDNPFAVGSVTGNMSRSKITAAPTTAIGILLNDPVERGLVLSGPQFVGNTIETITNISPQIEEGANLGVMHGGELTTTGGLTVTVGEGYGYLMVGLEPDDYLHLVEWESQDVIVPPDQDAFIYVDNEGIAHYTLSDPAELTAIFVGKVRTDSTTIIFMQQMPELAFHTAFLAQETLREALGPIYASGSIVSKNGNLQLNASSGHYFYGVNQYKPTGGSPIDWIAFYRNGSGNFVTVNQSSVDYAHYDDGSGVLADIPLGEYARHALYVVGDGADEKYLLVYAQVTYPTLLAAQSGSIPPQPGTWTGNIALIASIIVQNTPVPSNQIQQINDERPRIGFKASGISVVTDHGDLTGLLDDDHPQYLLTNGSRAVSGDFNMGTNNIVNVNLVDGVDVSAHASRHVPNGLDPLPTGVPVTIGTTNSVGIQNSFARSDHIHAHGNLVGGSLHALATQTTAGFMSAADKALLDTITTSFVPVAGGTMTGALVMNAQNQVRFADADSSNYVGLQAPTTIGTNYTLTLPTSVGTANQVLTTDVSGNLSWSSVQPLDSTLTALAAYNTNGLITQTAADTFTGRILTGTTNQVIVTNGDGVAGNPILSLPQNIHTGATPTFAGLTLSGFGTGVVHSNASGVLSASLIVDADVSSSAAIARSKIATSTPLHVVINDGLGNFSSEAQLSVSRGGTGLSTLTPGQLLVGAGTSPVTFQSFTPTNTVNAIVQRDGSGNFTAGTITANVIGSASNNVLKSGDTMTGALVMNAQNQVRFADVDSSNYVAVQAPTTIGTNYTLTLPAAVGTANQVLTTDASGNLTWSNVQAQNTNLTGLSGLAGVGIIAKIGTGMFSERLLLGTANQVNVINGDGVAGNPILSLPQNIHTGATPTFAGMTLSGFGTGVVHANASGVLSSSLIVDADISSSASIARSKIAAGTANHVVINDGSGNLSSEVALSVTRGGTGLGTLTSGQLLVGAGTSAVTFQPFASTNTASAIVQRDGSGNFAAGTITANLIGSASNNVLKSGDTMTGVLVMNAQNQVRFADVDSSNYVAVQAPTIIGTNYTLTLPTSVGTANQVLTTDAVGNLSWSSVQPLDSTLTALAAYNTNGLVTQTAVDTFTGRTLTGTTNQVIVTNGSGVSGNPTLSLPQDIHTGATPTFTGMTLSGFGTGVVHANASGVLSSSLIVDADISSSAAIARSKIGAGTANHVVINDGSGNLSSEAVLSVTRGGTGLSTLTSGQLLVGAGTSAVTFQPFASTNIASAIVQRDGSGNFAAGTITANLVGNVTGSASNNVLKSGDTMTGALVMDNQQQVRFRELTINGTNSVALQAPSSLVADYTLTLPTSVGTVNQVLTTDASGNLSWSSVQPLDSTLTALAAYNTNGLLTQTAADTFTGRTLTGTTNQVIVTNGNGVAGNPVLSLPQDIHTGATPTFAGMTLSGFGTGVVHANASGVLSSSLIVDADISSSAAIARSKLAFGTANHVVINDGSGNLSSEAVLSVTRGGTGLGTLTSGQLLVGAGTSAVTFQSFASTNTASAIVQRDASGNFAAGTITANLIGNVTGSASNNVLKSGDTMTGALVMDNQQPIRLREASANGTNYVGLQGPSALSSDYTLTLPTSTGLSGQVLTTDGIGQLMWQTVAHNAQNVLVVTKGTPQSPNEFGSVKAAVDSITTNSITNRFVVQVGPGIFIEDTITLKPYVAIVGDIHNETVIEVDSPSKDVFIASDESAIANVTIRGSSGPGKAAIVLTGGTLRVFTCRFEQSDILLKQTTTNGSAYSYFFNSNVAGGDSNFSKAFDISDTGGNLSFCALISFLWGPYDNPNLDAFMDISGPNTIVFVNSLLAGSLFLAMPGDGIRITNGSNAYLFATTLPGYTRALYVPNVGAGPYLEVGLNATGCIEDVRIDNPATTGSITGTMSRSKIFIDPNASIVLSALSSEDGSLNISGDIYAGSTVGTITNLSPQIALGSNLGVISGGVLTAGVGLSVNAALGTGYLMVGPEGSDYLKYIMWPAQNVALTANADNYIFVDDSGLLLASVAAPDPRTTIILGKARTTGSSILFVQEVPAQAAHTASALDSAWRAALGPVYHSGSIVSKNGTVQLNATAGAYVFGTEFYEPSGGSPISWIAFYRNGSGNFNTVAQSSIDYDHYDDGTGTLAVIPAGEFARHALYVVGDGSNEKYLLVYAQVTYPTLSDAQTGVLPPAPGTWTGNIALIASVIVQNTVVPADRIQQINDERPRLGFKASGINVITGHGDLTGLLEDDHPQYLLTNGGRSLAGNLDMGTFNIVNLGQANGVTVQAHASRHLPNGADPLATAVPVSISTANSVGIQNSFARSDHVHDHGSLPGGALHALATTSVAGFMSAADKAIVDNLSTTYLSLSGGALTGNLTLDNQQQVRFREQTVNGINSVALQAPVSLGADYTLTLPTSVGTANQVLTTDAVGNLSWSSVQPLDSTLTALAAYNTNGLVTQTAADTFTGRTLVGTTNQVIVTNGDGVAGNPTLSLPQNIHTGATPSFAGMTLSGFGTGIVHANASGVLSSSLIVDVDISSSAAIARSKIAAGTANHVVINDGSGNLSSEVALSVTRGGTGLSTLTSGQLLVGAGTSAVTFQPFASTNTANAIVQRDGSGNFAAGTITANLVGNVTGSASNNVLKSGDAMTGALTMNAQNQVRFADADSSNYVGLQAPTTIGTNYTLTLPTSVGTANQVLTTDAVGNLSWSSVQPLDSTLTALAAYNTNGLLTQTAADTFTGRTLTGTTNQVIVTNGNGVSGNPTLSLPQDIHTGATPMFAGLNLSGLAASQAVVTDASKNLASLAYTSTNTAGALVQRDGSGNFAAGIITANLTGSASNNVLKSGDSMTGALTMNAQNQVRFADADSSNYVALQAPTTIGTNYTLTLPTVVGTANQVLTTDVSGNLSWSSVQPLDSTLTALAAYNTNGLITQTAADTFTGRTLTGTTNQVIVTNGNGVSGNPTLSLPQNIHTGATPTFAGMTLSGFGTGVVHANASGVLSSSLIVDADISSSAAIARSKIASGTANHVVINDGSGNLSSEAALSVMRGGTGLSTLTSGQLLVGAGTSAVTFQPFASTNTGNAIVQRDGSGNFSAGTITANLIGNVTGSASNNVLKSGDTMTGTLVMDNQQQVRFREQTSNGTNYVGLQAPGSLANDYILTLPTAVGATNQVLTTDNSGNLSWSSVQPLDSTLTALAAYNTNGLITQIAADTFTGRILTGTTNQVIVTNGNGVAGNPILSLPQDIHTGATPTFVGLNLSGLTASQAVVTDASKNLASLVYTSANTASTLVQRDASGNFAAGTITLAATSADSNARNLDFTKNRSGGVITSGDRLGTITFQGFDGASMIIGSQIRSNSSGTIATNRIASNLEFFTHPDSTVASTQRVVISSAGNVTINSPDSGVGLTISGGGLTSTGTTTLSSLASVGLVHTNVSGVLSTSLLVDADVSSSAAIARNKIAVGTANHVVINDGSGNLSSEAQLAVSRGGTGLGTLTSGQLLVGAGTSAVTFQPFASTNTASAIVQRDGSGNFAAGIITANLTGNVTGSLTGSASNNVLKTGDTMTGTLNMATQNEIRFQDAAGGQYVGLRAPATIPTNYTLNLPTATGSANQVLSTDGAGNLSWATVASGATGAHVFAYDATTQTVGTINVFQSITFSNNASLSGWTHAAGTSTFTCNVTGLYMITFNGNVGISGNSNVSMLVRQNSVEIAGSQTLIAANSSNGSLNISKTIVASILAGDTIDVRMTGSSTSNRIVANTGSGTTRPSIVITIIKI